MVLAALALALTATPVLWLRRADGSIVPPEPLPLGGYTARGEHVFEPGGDDLRARVAVLEQGDLRVALVSVEMLTIPGSLSREVQARIPSDVKLILCATHTHCAPDSQMLNERMTIQIPGIATFKRRWLDWYATQIAATVREALVAKPNEFQLDLAISRPQSGDNWLNRPRRTRGFAEPNFWRFADLAMVYSAHPTLLDEHEKRLRGDWPGELARRTGLLPFAGAIGDRSPTPVDGGPAAFARVLADAPIVSGTAASETRMRFIEEPIQLDPPKPSPAFISENKTPEALAQLIVGKFAEPEAKITVVGLGSVALVFVPGEPTSEVGRTIFNLGARAAVFPVVVGLATNWIGYILSPADYDDGGYEASLSLHGRETGLRVVEAATRALDKLRASRSDTEGASRTPRARLSSGSSFPPPWTSARSGLGSRRSARPSAAPSQ